MRIKKGDTVKILVGKDASRRGQVVKVMPREEKVIIDGMNVYKKHMKGDGQQKQSAIIEISKPVAASNVMVICPACDKPSRVRYTDVSGKKVRVCKKCGKEIDGAKVEKKEEKKIIKKAAKKTTKKSSAKAKKTTKTKTTKK